MAGPPLWWMVNLLRSFNGCFSEIFHQFADVEGCFACPCAGCLVPFFNLCVGISDESIDFSLDLIYKLFHEIKVNVLYNMVK